MSERGGGGSVRDESRGVSGACGGCELTDGMRQCKAHVQAARAVVSEQPAARASLTEVRVRERAYCVPVEVF